MRLPVSRGRPTSRRRRPTKKIEIETRGNLSKPRRGRASPTRQEPDSTGAAKARYARRLALLLAFMAEARATLRWTRRPKPTRGGGDAARLRKEQNRMAKCAAILRRLVQEMEREPEPRPPPRGMRGSDYAAPRRKAAGRGKTTLRRLQPR